MQLTDPKELVKLNLSLMLITILHRITIAVWQVEVVEEATLKLINRIVIIKRGH